MGDSKNRERGLRAAINNPRVSEEAKQHDRDLLASEFGEHTEQQPQTAQSKRRSSASHKSSSTGPHLHAAEGQADKQGSSSTGAEKPQATGRRARRASSGDTGGLQSMVGEKDRGNVIRGLKAALKNPNVSEKAKEADRKKLQELGETVE